MKSSPECRVSHPHLVLSQAAPNGETKYWQCTALIPKNDAAGMAWLKELAAECQKVVDGQFPDPAKRPRIPMVGHEKSPIKDGDTATDQNGMLLCEKYPEYSGHYLVRASAKDDGRPARHKVVDTSNLPITNNDLVYGGCRGRINVNPYWRKVKTNPGVSLGLQGFQKTKDDEPFGTGPANVDDMFEKTTGANDPANYGDDPFATQPAASTSVPDPFAM